MFSIPALLCLLSLYDAFPLRWMDLTTAPAYLLLLNFLEYSLHRGPMHRPGTKLFDHVRKHHVAWLRDGQAISDHDVIIPLYAMAVYGAFVGILALGIGWVINWHAGYVFLACGWGYYFTLEILHYTCHHGGLVKFSQHHLRHHAGPGVSSNYNFSFPVFDVIFGTYRGKREAAQRSDSSETLRHPARLGVAGRGKHEMWFPEYVRCSHRHWHCHHHQHVRKHYWFVTDKCAVLLIPNTEIFMAQQLHVDQIDTISIAAVDAAGNPVVATFDSPPVWTNSNPLAATNVVSSDGLTNVLTPVAGATGQVTTVAVTAIIGGTTFTASSDYTIVAGAVAGINLVDSFSPTPVAPATPTS